MPILDVSSPRRRTFQAGLFLLAIVAPCLLLVALSALMVRQDRELTAKRAEDRRRLTAERARQALLSRLERLKLDATSEGSDMSGVSQPGDGPVALTASLVESRLRLPWDDDPAVARFRAEMASPAFSRALADGQRREFVSRDASAAFLAYREAYAAAHSGEQQAAARLAAARVAVSAGRWADAARLAEQLLSTPASLLDDEGVPIALYGAQLLRRSPLDEDMCRRATATLSGALNRRPPVNPAALHMTTDLAAHLICPASIAPELETLRARAIRRLTDAGRAQALRTEYASIRARPPNPDEPTWVPFGPHDEMWLVTEVARLKTDAAMVVAIRSANVFAEIVRAGGDIMTNQPAADETATTEPLGGTFPGLFVRIPSMPEAALLQRRFLFGAVALTLGATLCGAYYFWRDTQRDLRMATLRSQFVSSVSHELKTPLTAIRMFADTLRLRAMPSPQVRDEYLSTIVNESERLTRLLNNVLDFSKIEQGQRQYRLAPHRIAPIVRSAVRTLQYQLEQQRFTVTLEIEDEGVVAGCDPDAIEQAVLNPQDDEALVA